MLDYFIEVLEDNHKLQSCSKCLFVTLLVVLSFFVPLLLLQLCEWSNSNPMNDNPAVPMPFPLRPTESPVVPKQFNVLVFTLMEHEEYWRVIKKSLIEYYSQRVENMHIVRFGHYHIDYQSNFASNFNYREYLKCPEIWNKYRILNPNKTAEIRNLCNQFDAVLLIQQHFVNDANGKLLRLMDDHKVNELFEGYVYGTIPLIVVDADKQEADDHRLKGALMIQMKVTGNGDDAGFVETVLSVSWESFDVMVHAISCFLS